MSKLFITIFILIITTSVYSNSCTPNHSHETFECVSSNHDYDECEPPHPLALDVCLHREMDSSYGCEEGETWGVNRSNDNSEIETVWVDKGCKGYFRFLSESP